MTADPARTHQTVPFLTAELKQRVLWGVILAVTALIVTIIGGWVMTIGVAAMAAVVAREWAGISMSHDTKVAAALALPSAGAVLIAGAGEIGISVAFALLSSLTVGAWLRSPWATAGVIYASALGVSLVALRGPALGLEAVIFVFAVVWATDSGAYLAGRRIGGVKLWPAVSPKKTWAGAIGGGVAAVIAGLAVGWVSDVSIGLAFAATALALSVTSQIGDLFESALKRRFGTKDASALIPGHGGLMDRVDGLAFAVVAAALLGWARAGWPELGLGLLVW